jgi:hypothetical protein
VPAEDAQDVVGIPEPSQGLRCRITLASGPLADGLHVAHTGDDGHHALPENLTQLARELVLWKPGRELVCLSLLNEGPHAPGLVGGPYGCPYGSLRGPDARGREPGLRPEGERSLRFRGVPSEGSGGWLLRTKNESDPRPLKSLVN